MSRTHEPLTPDALLVSRAEPLLDTVIAVRGACPQEHPEEVEQVHTAVLRLLAAIHGSTVEEEVDLALERLSTGASRPTA